MFPSWFKSQPVKFLEPMVPCEICGAAVSFHDFADHMARHLDARDGAHVVFDAIADSHIVSDDDGEVDMSSKEQVSRARSSSDRSGNTADIREVHAILANF